MNPLIFLMFILTACATAEPPDRMLLEQKEFHELPRWPSGETSGALAAFRRSCGKLRTMPDDRPLGEAGGAAGDWKPACHAAESASPETAAAFFQEHFTPFLVTNNGRTEGLFTGYYEPELRGSRKRKDRYVEPVYRRPAELEKPYLGRRRIGNGELAGRGLELAWVDDPVELFFLHIQGSGRIRLEDGRVMRVGYHDQNGCPYLAIGRYLVEQGELTLEQADAQGIKAWLRANPGKARDVMNRNQSFVFFRELEGDGPVGTQGVALTPEHSLAVDRRYIPLGAPVWLDTALPGEDDWNYSRLLIAQDTGGAIKGVVRGDVFFGPGARAERLAGMMRQRGRYYLLLPKAAEPETATAAITEETPWDFASLWPWGNPRAERTASGTLRP